MASCLCATAEGLPVALFADKVVSIQNSFFHIQN
jgi:hypothetical protein